MSCTETIHSSSMYMKHTFNKISYNYLFNLYCLVSCHIILYVLVYVCCWNTIFICTCKCIPSIWCEHLFSHSCKCLYIENVCIIGQWPYLKKDLRCEFPCAIMYLHKLLNQSSMWHIKNTKLFFFKKLCIYLYVIWM